MNNNVGGIDKIARIVAGAALVGWALLGGPVWAWFRWRPACSAGVRSIACSV